MLQQSPYLFRVCLGLDSSSQGWSVDSTWKKKVSVTSPLWVDDEPPLMSKTQRQVVYWTHEFCLQDLIGGHNSNRAQNNSYKTRYLLFS